MKKKSKNFSILDKDIEVNGSIVTRGRLVVKGTLKGSLEGETVTIAEEGAVYAEVKAAAVTIAGTFEGEVRASEELVLLSTGSCTGKVVCKDLVIEAGGVLNAEVTCLAVKDSKSDGTVTELGETSQATDV